MGKQYYHKAIKYLEKSLSKELSRRNNAITDKNDKKENGNDQSYNVMVGKNTLKQYQIDYAKCLINQIL